MTRMMDLHEVLSCLAGGMPVGDMAVVIDRVHTDTRSLKSGDLFVALKGEHYDANQFLAQARERGAVAAICHPGAGLAGAGLPGIEVHDTRQALGALGAAWRARFELPLIAVTGSNGKTTVTQMLASILRAYKPAATLATLGNFNNDIGVPLSLLRLRAEHRIAVLELGMNHPGESARLAAMARPTVALVNNAQREHLEFMATVEAVAHENGAVIGALPPAGVAVFPHDDSYAGLWRRLASTRPQMTFAVQPAPAQPGAAPADVRCEAPAWTDGAWQVQAHTPAGAFAFALRVAGLHNVHNALAATACALAAGVGLAEIRRGLETFEPVKGRSRTIALTVDGKPCTLVDDSYNANPDSVQAALVLLASLPAPRLMVLGDMAEVGDQGEQFHAQAGRQARALGIELLFTLGARAQVAARQFSGARHFGDMTSLVAATRAALPGCASVLVKGSRFMQMERLVQALAPVPPQGAERAGDAPCC